MKYKILETWWFGHMPLSSFKDDWSDFLVPWEFYSAVHPRDKRYCSIAAAKKALGKFRIDDYPYTLLEIMNQSIKDGEGLVFEVVPDEISNHKIYSS